MIGPADVAEVRRTNLSHVLKAVDALAPCSRTDIRHSTGLVSGSVSSLVDDLTARGLVEETGQTTSKGRGRPRRVLTLGRGRVVSIALQLTPDQVVSQIRDLGGELRWQSTAEHAIRSGSSADLLAALVDAVTRAEEAAGRLPGTWVSGTVIGVPGPVAGGRALADSITFGIARTDLFAPLTEALPHDRHLIVMNDGRLGALAEYTALPASGRPKAMAYVTADPGVSGGLILGGEPYLGAHLMAGECGHIAVAMDGPPCACGTRGCLTLYLGTEAILHAAGLAPVARDRGRGDAMRELTHRLDAGDVRALTALDRAGLALASAIGTMSNYTDVDLVVLGGDLTHLERWLRPRVRELINARRSRIPEFSPEVALARHDDDAALVGGWLLSRGRVLRDPGLVPPLPRATSPEH